MPSKTRKHYKKHKKDHLEKTNNVKKGTQLKCKLKTCKSKMYQSVYGMTRGGNIRSARPLYF